MTRVIDAVFENGVFKPLERVEFTDHERIRIKIISNDDWQRQFRGIIDKIHARSLCYTSEEIEADIAEALEEVRDGRA